MIASIASRKIIVTHQILAEHLVDGRLIPGEELQLRVDQALLQDATRTMACLELEQLGRAIVEEKATDPPTYLVELLSQELSFLVLWPGWDDLARANPEYGHVPVPRPLL
jgi:hypothetical protein